MKKSAPKLKYEESYGNFPGMSAVRPRELRIRRICVCVTHTQLSSRPITSEPVPIPPLCKRLQIALMVVSTVQVRNMRYVVGRNRQAAAGQLIISIIYLLINIIYLSNNLI